MESVIQVFLNEGVSVDAFDSYTRSIGINEDPFVQDVLKQLIAEQVSNNPATPHPWDEDDADRLLSVLQSPSKVVTAKTPARTVLKEKDVNIQPNSTVIQIGHGDTGESSKTHYACPECLKTFGNKHNMKRHVKCVHQKITYDCTKCGRSYTQNSKLTEHKSKCISLSKVIPAKTSARTVMKKKDINTQSKTPRTHPIGPGESSKTHFSCPECMKTFASKQNMDRHIKGIHKKITFICTKCGKSYTQNPQRIEHEAKCVGKVTFPCNMCSEVLKTQRELQYHMKIKHKIKPSPRRARHIPKSANSEHINYSCRHCDANFQQINDLRSHNCKLNTESTSKDPHPAPHIYNCRRCPAQFQDRQALHAHNIQRHYQVGAGLHSEPFEEGHEPWVNEDGSINEGLRDCYRINRALILERYNEGPVESIYNIPISPEVSIPDIGEAFQGIFDRQHNAFKVNLSFGFIMRHVETGRYRYFRPYDNVNVFDVPVLISRRSDIAKVLKKLEVLDVMSEMSKNRPDTKWRLELITNIRVKIYNTNFALGVVNDPLPAFVIKHKSIISLDKDPVYKHPYQDNLCLFRCLCLHRHGSTDKPKVNKLFSTWESRYTQREFDELLGNHTPEKTFQGVQLQELPEFEEMFETNVHVYELLEDGVVVPVFKSTERYRDNMIVNQHGNHCSLVTDFDQYAKKFKCQLCDWITDHNGHLNRHLKICDKKTLFNYPGGFYREKPSIFQELDKFGINVPESDRVFHWFAVYDFESMLVKLRDDTTEKMEWTHQHVPISVSLCSNIPGHTSPRCLVNSDMDELIGDMVNELNIIQGVCEEQAEEKWGSYLQKLGDIINNQRDLDEEDVITKSTMKNLYGKFKGYMSTLPVLGFNSAKYDLNLVKQKLAKYLKMHEQEHGFVVKKCNSYACITTDKFRFLDISHFLAPGTSYAGFLKAYRVEETKGFFPYEWLDGPEKLDQTELPPYESFYSALKGTNISPEEYAYCQNVWLDRGMTTFKDFLIWYNDLDVGPFVTAVERLQKFYFDKRIDVLKTAMSVPGIARQLLFKSARNVQAEFSLIDKKNADLYQTIKENIIGGPSIIFTRHHEVGKTTIRGDKKCQKVVGYDANALYLWAIGQPMPEGVFVRRRAENDFKPEHRDQYMQAFNWLNYLNTYDGTHILHQRNNGKEVRIGKYPVDGYDPDTNTVYEFQGCYHHGHQCDVTKNVSNEKWQKTKDTLRERTEKKVAELRQKGYVVVEMWECDFRLFCKQHPHIFGIRDKCRPAFSLKHKGKVTENQILNGVLSGQLFGMVECDIEVPEQWGSEFDHMSTSPRQYFEEMCPIFCNTDVGFDDIGEHMQEHVWEHQLSDKPRRLLVGGTKARQILLATPLLKWYLKHGLKVTKIYQVIEYRKMACFDSFVKEVSDARRAGDICKSMAIIADTMKLIGNSGYGSLIMDQTKHRNIKYVEGENKACFEINKPQFRQTTCLDETDQYYEIELAKKNINLNLPIQLGFFILQYAKLRMLEFYYDFLDSYVDRSDFEYLEMDTDSAYMALSASTLREVVKPEKISEFQNGLTGLCDDKYNPVGDRWLPRECCEKHAKFDKRVPGLFKTEYEGEQMIGLCSKTYIVSKTVPSKASSAIKTASTLLRKAKGLKRQQFRRPLNTIECKFSSKGISKRLVKDPLNIFKRVLRTGKAASGHNKGFRVRNNGIYSYEQTRCGFSYFYCKRRVLHDGIHTVPLDIVLCPKKQKNVASNEAEKMEDADFIDLLSETQFEKMLK